MYKFSSGWYIFCKHIGLRKHSGWNALYVEIYIVYHTKCPMSILEEISSKDIYIISVYIVFRKKICWIQIISDINSIYLVVHS